MKSRNKDKIISSLLYFEGELVMKKHLLLTNIHFYETSDNRIEGTEGSYYSKEKGYWLINNTNTPLVQDSKRPLPSTKKHDIERGEDRK